MGNTTGFGITSSMAANETPERQLACLEEFGKLGLTPLFCEVIENKVYTVAHLNGTTIVEEYNGPDKEKILANWSSYCGDISSEVAEDMEFINIFIPGTVDEPDHLGTISIPLLQNSEYGIAHIAYGHEIMECFFEDTDFMEDEEEEWTDQRNDLLFLSEKLKLAERFNFIFCISAQ